MKAVRFLEERTFERVGKPTLVYEAGSVHTLKDDHARRWVTRHAAEYVATEVVVHPDDGARVLNVVLPITPVADPGDGAPLPDASPQEQTAEADGVVKEPADGNTLESAEAVAGADGGGAGQRPEHVAGGRGRGARGKAAGNRGQ